MEHKNGFLNRIISYAFRLIFALLIVTNYIYFVLYTWLPLTIKHTYPWVLLTTFHILLIMVLWTLAIISTSDPGQVPIYWGFYFGDSDSKRRRYCLMCNVFKPDRCHHCSICNKCVLNMDHHCPWINNCIGFFNRKFFIQMLFYLCLTILYILAANGKFTYDMVTGIISNRVNMKKEFSEHLGYIFLYTMDVVMLIIVGLFFKFHLALVLENKTTIETIDKKGVYFISMFSRGSYQNWIQVMGSSKLLWFLPLNLYMGMPKGNGMDWEEPLVFDERKMSRDRDDSMSSDCHSHSRHENNVENGIDQNQNQNRNKPEKKVMRDCGSISSLYNKSSDENAEKLNNLAFLKNDKDSRLNYSPEKNKLDNNSDTSQTGLNIRQIKYIDKNSIPSNLNGIQKVEINMVNINIKKPADFEN